MTQPHRLFVGTIGEGLFRSLDGGRTFRRACEGMFVECDVRALAVHPANPSVLYLGSEQGLFVSRDGADSWSRLEAPLVGLQVWSVWLAPDNPDRILVGTCPARVFRSEDGGRTWAEAQTRMTADCPRILHTRVTCLAGDPAESGLLWAGVEIDGLHRSADGGRSWQPVGTGLSSRDIHALAVVPARDGRAAEARPRRLLAATNNDLNLSTDDGQTWRPLEVRKALPWSYCRALAQPCGAPDVVLLGMGDGPPGAAGSVARSVDGGDSWEVSALPGRANSTVWNFATHPADPDLIYAASVSGEVYCSAVAGASWHKLAREFGEVRALAWVPGT
jgi:photosystem II stability/assembly factor-like uncharacterized protein